MKKKNFVYVLLAMVLVMGFMISGCDNGTTGSGNNSTSLVPEWAYGPWYNSSSGASRIKVAEISSTQLILYKNDGSIDLTAKFIDSYEYTAYDSNMTPLGKGVDIKFEYGRTISRDYNNDVYLMVQTGTDVSSTGSQIFK